MSSFVHMENPYRNLKRLAFAVGLLLVTCSTMAQQAWFIFIQSENKQPFYARINDRIYSSSSIGYLTLSDLRDSTYSIAIGFPGKQYREETFSIPLGGKDHGYQLKRSGSQEWVLYNWQNQHTVRPAELTKENEQTGERKKDDEFAGLMAAVVNDSAVLYATVIKKPVPEKPPVVKQADTPGVIMDSGWVLNKTTASVDSLKVEPPVKEESKVVDTQENKQVISKLKEETNSKEKKLVFLDMSPIKTDTITVIIPVEKKPEPPKQEEKKVAVHTDSTSSVTDAAKPKAVMNMPATTTDTTVTSIAESKKTDSAAVVKTDPVPEKKSSVTIINSDCRNFATEHDVDKLRVKMLNEKLPANRIFQAFKVFKTKCFTTRQVHALSELFDTDENRYKFFETAWPYVSDSTQFKTLEEAFTDDFFKSRFRTLVRSN